MRSAAALADRNLAVRDAAADWRAAGLIAEPAEAAIRELYPDDRQRLSWWLRALLFVFTWLAIWSGEGMIWALFTVRDALGVLLLVAGVGLVALAELQTGRLRLAGFGTDDATEFAAYGHLLAGIAVLQRDTLHASWEQTAMWTLSAAVLLGVPAAWHWGGTVFGLLAAAAGFGFLAQFAGGRLLWLLAGALLLVALLPLETSERLAPAQRRAVSAALLVALAGLYLAVNLRSLDGAWIEDLDFGDHHFASLLPRWFAVAGTALVPPLLTGLGLLRRRRLVLDAGLLAAAASLVTLRFYVHIAALWLVLVASGLALLGLALLVRRRLAAGINGERAGYTAAAAFGDARRRTAMEAAAVLATLSPTPAQAPPEGFQGGGGEAGGGGATAQF